MQISLKFSVLFWDIGSVFSLGVSYRKSMTWELWQLWEVPFHIKVSAQLCQEPGYLYLLCLALASSVCVGFLNSCRNSRQTSRQHKVQSKEEGSLYLCSLFHQWGNLPLPSTPTQPGFPSCLNGVTWPPLNQWLVLNTIIGLNYSGLTPGLRAKLLPWEQDDRRTNN